jgi:hypothetical protein
LSLPAVASYTLVSSCGGAVGCLGAVSVASLTGAVPHSISTLEHFLARCSTANEAIFILVFIVSRSCTSPAEGISFRAHLALFGISCAWCVQVCRLLWEVLSPSTAGWPMGNLVPEHKFLHRRMWMRRGIGVNLWGTGRALSNVQNAICVYYVTVTRADLIAHTNR